MSNAKYAATRLTVPLGVAVLVVMSTVVLALVSTVSPAVRLAADSTALIMGWTSVSTPDGAYIDVVKNQYIAPTHPGQDIDYVAVTAPEEWWPITGLVRILGFAVGPPIMWGPGGPAWPNEPWWKLSGLFDLTQDQSGQAGVADLEAAMAEHGNDHLVIYGYSQGAMIAVREKRKLAAQYPAGTTAPHIDFVLSGDLNVPNGGLFARFPGLYIPIFGSFNGPEPTDTPFDTVVITRQYDGLADFPLYPLNVIADLNAVLGTVYVHTHELDVSLPPNPSMSPAFQGTHGDSSYYFFPTQDLPLFAPLRTLGVPEKYIDVVEPFFRVLVELGYDRSIPPWQPTPARLIPTTLNPGKVATDLVNAIGEGINNAFALFGSPAPLRLPAAPAAGTGQSTSQQIAGTGQSTSSKQRGDTGQSTSSKQRGDTGQSTSSKQRGGTGQSTSSKQRGDTGQSTSSKQRGDTGQSTSSKQRGGTGHATTQPTKRDKTAGPSSAASSSRGSSSTARTSRGSSAGSNTAGS